jgi:hypothetical protein
MKNEFIPYEQALELKQIGFDEPCFGRYYYKDSYPMLNINSGETELVFEFGRYVKQSEVTILGPLYQQAFRWFRQKYRLTGLVEIGTQEYSFLIFDENTDSREITSSMNGAYEEAELACLKKLIEIVKTK